MANLKRYTVNPNRAVRVGGIRRTDTVDLSEADAQRLLANGTISEATAKGGKGGKSAPETDTTELLAGNAPAVIAAVAGLSPEVLERLKAEETEGKGRTTVLEAIEAELAKSGQE